MSIDGIAAAKAAAERNGPRAWVRNAWRILHTGAALLVLALSPSSYRATTRRTIVRHLVLATAPNLLSSILLSALITLVLVRIVVVTAISYGLSQYALEMVIRTLVLELIPLAAVLFVALRVAVLPATQIAALRRAGLGESATLYPDRLRDHALPLALANMFAVLLLAAVSCVVAALLSYFTVYGFTTGGFDQFTRTFGRVFNPMVTLVFVLKTLFFSLVVGLLPVASVLVDRRGPRPRTGIQVRALVRMLFLILLIEAASLIGNYY